LLLGALTLQAPDATCAPTEKAPENSHSRGLFLESWWDRWSIIVAQKPHQY